jgi:uncharacterized repeat protein (TIGR02543 family)
MKRILFYYSLIFILLTLFSCDLFEKPIEKPIETYYSVIYNGNGSTGGTVPVDPTLYKLNRVVTVLGNTGSLGKEDYIFAGWNTKADGTGTGRLEGSSFYISDNITLYAQWTDSGILQFVSGTYRVDERGGSISLDVTRTEASKGEVAISFATADDTAVSGKDYTGTSGTLSWADGEAGTKTIRVFILDDDKSEGNQTFLVALSAPTGGAAIGAGSVAEVIILDDEPSRLIMIYPSRIKFGTVKVGKYSSIYIDISNYIHSNQNLTGAVNLTYGEFLITGAGNFTLWPGQTIRVWITFSPRSVGVKESNLIISHNATNILVPIIVPVSGTGGNP